MSESNHSPSGNETLRQDLIEKTPEGDDGRHSQSERKTFGKLIGSLLRICTNAEHMLERDERWHVRKNASANDVLDTVFDSMRDCEQEYRRWRTAAPEKKVNSPHPLGAVAELLVAKTLATVGGEEAVKDLSKWTRKAESKFAGRAST